MRKSHGKDTASFVISDMEEAVVRGREMLPKLRRRWMCKYGALRTDIPDCTPQQREYFKKLKKKYLELQQLANSMESQPIEDYGFVTFPLNL
ncbi:hypothetical protein CGK40_19840 [Vibrio parahaemolyticus]|uniref:hypothetical protein n=1 Tax=Vibrio parahaemolyticus TaxID=670 RepID=UPI001122709E|nr:hypothetical protein [Vibrio parahaemolyticus]TNZ90875.1 hypothetical protein CGK40_19840 [Vibrio parahaemolyticus]